MGIGRFFFGSNFVRMQGRPSMKSRYGRISSKPGMNASSTKSNSYRATKQSSGSSVAAMMDLSAVSSKRTKSQRTLQKFARAASSGNGLLNPSSGSSDLFSTDILISGQQIVKVPESTRQAIFDETKRQFIENNGSVDDKSAQRTEVYQDYLKGTSKRNQASGTWTLTQNESQYRDAMTDAVKAANPSWKEGQPFNKKLATLCSPSSSSRSSAS